MCDLLTTQPKDKLVDSGFVRSFVVVNPQYFKEFSTNPPTKHLKEIAKHYPDINLNDLTELLVVYKNENFQIEECNSIHKLLQLF